jgi:deoxyribonuclease V
MKPTFTHAWEVSEAEAISIQEQLSSKVITKDQLNKVNYIAGVDVAYAKHSDKIIASVVTLDSKTLNVVDSVTVESTSEFPYISGLFSFRELPALIEALSKLKHTPDLIVCDGHGYSHPRRFGLACHLGLLFNIPTIGCGKTLLLGQYDQPEQQRGASAPLIDNHEVIGSVLRTQSNIKPVYVSVGHRVSLETACDWILKLTPKYRLPETTRQADQLVKIKLKELANN